MPDLIEDLLESTEEENKKLAEELKDEDGFYCLGSGVNFGLAYKLAMTMLMEGAIKHACPLYSAEFRHGLIERAEKDVPLILTASSMWPTVCRSGLRPTWWRTSRLTIRSTTSSLATVPTTPISPMRATS